MMQHAETGYGSYDMCSLVQDGDLSPNDFTPLKTWLFATSMNDTVAVNASDPSYFFFFNENGDYVHCNASFAALSANSPRVHRPLAADCQAKPLL